MSCSRFSVKVVKTIQIPVMFRRACETGDKAEPERVGAGTKTIGIVGPAALAASTAAARGRRSQPLGVVRDQPAMRAMHHNGQ